MKWGSGKDFLPWQSILISTSRACTQKVMNNKRTRNFLQNEKKFKSILPFFKTSFACPLVFCHFFCVFFSTTDTLKLEHLLKKKKKRKHDFDGQYSTPDLRGSQRRPPSEHRVCFVECGLGCLYRACLETCPQGSKECPSPPKHACNAIKRIPLNVTPNLPTQNKLAQ